MGIKIRCSPTGRWQPASRGRVAQNGVRPGLWLQLAGATALMALLMFDAQGASTLLDYGKRIIRAREQVERLKTDSPAYAEEDISYIERLAPKSEEVTVGGQTITTDNAWLHNLLAEYSNETDPPKRTAKLNEAAGRLKVLDEQIREAQAEPSSADGKASSGEKIRQILERAEYQERREDPVTAFIKKLWERVMRFLGKIYAALANALLGPSGAGTMFARVLLVLIVLGFGAALFLLGRRLRWRRRGPKVAKKRTVLGEEIEEGTTSRDLAGAALAAAQAGDFRSGIRKLYISLLYELAERRMIDLESHITNHEYLAKVSRFSSLAAPMGYLTERFDVVWYGIFPGSKDDFSACFACYEEAIKAAGAQREGGV